MGSLSTLPDEEFIFRSKLPDITIPDQLPLHDYCFERIAAVADRPCIVYGPSGVVYTYAEVQLTARRVAAGLHRLGIRRGDVIMLLLTNSPEFAFSFLGASYAGATTTTANPLYTSSEILKQIQTAGVKLVVTQSSFVDKVRDSGVKIMPSVEVRPDDVVALPYSSGTTGLPKGVMLSHRSLVASIAQQLEGENPNLWFRGDDVLLCALPLFHIYSLNTVLLCALRAGATIVIMPRFELVAMMELVERHRVTIAPFVPPIILALSKCPRVEEYDLSSIRMVMYGAAPISKDLEDALQSKIPDARFGQGYGMTEAGALSMSLGFAKEPFRTKQGSCGTVVRNAELKVVDPDSGASLRRNEAGEICIKGPQIMKGYLNDPEATARTIDGKGWLHTGDIGYVDDEDEIFIVPPAELEALLLSHPAVADAAVVPMKDEAAGEVPVAFVVRSSGSGVTEEEIKLFISQQVVFYKRIRRVFFVDVIPRRRPARS
ncbi:unnamed protein product [Spirodela intermedia]|uniref:4-coumarate--CoA ligase n=1 Tax=Spirodela intermedia TaxID=51605 RepID=A0A7I8JJH8_SPIIN|nr:unnamed protein product [Spirodela intermedia]CAA6670318.1 unnamed protein product [Spirodela intermedia]